MWGQNAKSNPLPIAFMGVIVRHVGFLVWIDESVNFISHHLWCWHRTSFPISSKFSFKFQSWSVLYPQPPHHHLTPITGTRTTASPSPHFLQQIPTQTQYAFLWSSFHCCSPCGLCYGFWLFQSELHCSQLCWYWINCSHRHLWCLHCCWRLFLDQVLSHQHQCYHSDVSDCFSFEKYVTDLCYAAPTLIASAPLPQEERQSMLVRSMHVWVMSLPPTNTPKTLPLSLPPPLPTPIQLPLLLS